MYFKERENSRLYQHYQQQEQRRLSKKLEEIKTHTSRNSASTTMLPTIHRKPQIRPYQQSILTAESDRLQRRIKEIKHKKSEYFSKVIKLNRSLVDINHTQRVGNECTILTRRDSNVRTGRESQALTQHQ